MNEPTGPAPMTAKPETVSVLLPCPCGAVVDLGECPYPVSRIPGTLFRIQCADGECGWSLVADTEEQAIAAWNRRALAAAPPAEPVPAKDWMHAAPDRMIDGQHPIYPPVIEPVPASGVTDAMFKAACDAYSYACHHDAMRRALEAALAPLLAENERLRAENEQLRVQLAGCGVAAMGNTREALERNRLSPGTYGYSESYADCLRAAEREIVEREAKDAAEREARELRERLKANLPMIAAPSFDAAIDAARQDKP